MLLYLKGAPALDNTLEDLESKSANVREIEAFVEKIMSAKKETSNPEINKLSASRQTHRHTRPCYKGGSARQVRQYLDTNTDAIVGSSTTFSDFLGVFGATEDDYILAVCSTLRNSKVLLAREPRDLLTNNYNPRILELMGSNCDLQFVVSAYACCAYTVDYINKNDKGMSDHLKSVLHQSLSNNESVRQVLASIALAFYNRSEISAQEVAYNLLQLRIVESNLSTIFVASSPPDTRQRLRKSKLELQELVPDSEDI
ncbi:hypothetical protein [Parasitella parasitica]|uniref:Uncharacterized protein n=1 Tax=Parasitella parasitica TaxID=35722 RepID=A0A0B7NMY5_9FUNG|nr:hypothetical protein [Parasitella parasitica]